MKLTLLAMYHPAAALHQPRLWAEMLDDWQHMPEKVPSDFRVVTTQESLREKDINFDGRSLASLDTEKDGLGGLGQWSVAYRDGEGHLWVVPFFGRRQVEFGGCPVAFHNFKYDCRELKANGITPPKNIHDTMIMAYCLGLGRQAPKDDSKTKSGSDMVGGLGLKFLARRHLGMEMKRWDEVKDSPEEIPEYNAKDSIATYLLAEKWLPILPKHYFDIDMPLLSVLMAIEDRGIQIDPNFLEEYAKELDNRLANFDLPLNPHATQEIQSYVYGTLGIEPWRFTESGAPSVDADVLETIHDPLVEQILAYKELYKDKGTYVENYVKMRDEENRIHPELKQVSTSTGRLSCARPNLQNVDKEGNMRKLFVAPQGKKLVRMDYDQLEWRVLAAITQDPILLEALESGKKIHQVTAEQMGIKYDDAKSGNFAIIYGAQAWTLAQTLHCTIGQAKEFMRLYFEKFPGVKRYQAQMKEVALKEKKVTNWFGRTRRIDAMYVDQWRVREEGIKEAINTPIQGAGGEICKIGMIALHKHNAPMVLQIHDELLFEVAEKDAVEFGQWLKEFVPSLVEINGVKFPVDIKIGSNWWECSQ